MKKTYPVMTAFVSGNLDAFVSALTSKLIATYPALSENRAKEIAAAYLFIDFKIELDVSANDLEMSTISLRQMVDDYPVSFQSAVIDATGSRSLLIDEYEINKHVLPFTLQEYERRSAYK